MHVQTPHATPPRPSIRPYQPSRQNKHMWSSSHSNGSDLASSTAPDQYASNSSNFPGALSGIMTLFTRAVKESEDTLMWTAHNVGIPLVIAAACVALDTLLHNRVVRHQWSERGKNASMSVFLRRRRGRHVLLAISLTLKMTVAWLLFVAVVQGWWYRNPSDNNAKLSIFTITGIAFALIGIGIWASAVANDIYETTTVEIGAKNNSLMQSSILHMMTGIIAYLFWRCL